MRVETESAGPESVEADLFGIPIADPPLPSFEGVNRLDRRLDGRLATLIEEEGLTGKLGECALLLLPDGAGIHRIAAAGIGRVDEVDADALRTATSSVVRAAGRIGGTLTWLLEDSLPLDAAEQARAVVDGAVLGGYDPGRWKSNGDAPSGFDRVVLAGGGVDRGVAEAAERAARIAEAANRARDLANGPANELTPERLAARAQEIAGEHKGLSAQALGPKEVRKLGMGAFAAVGQGSHNEPRMIVMRYEPPSASGDVVLGLVGKAITFDTGGISIKPANYMEDMKGDMAGGAAVVEGMGVLAELGLPLRAIAVVAATENMPGGGAFRPGDILTAMNGKTIEVINTDAEGRLVLADALWHARQQGATHLLDLATLTGAMELAMGDFHAGVFGNDDAWRDAVVAAGEASGDHAWPWPLHHRYRRYVDSTFADVKNSSILRQASPILAAEFLREFTGEGPWAHIDMAGTGYHTFSRPDYLWQKGGTGYGVRLIAELASRLAS